MSYVSPPTFVDADDLTAAQLNILGDDIVYLKAQRDAMVFTGVALSRSTDLSVSDSTWTDISWVSATVDTSSFWTSGANITVPASAIPSGSTQVVMEINIQARFNSNGTGGRACQVLLNGSTVERSFGTSALTGDTTVVGTTVWAIVAAADVLKGQIRQTSGGALIANSMSMHVKRIGFL